jgi:3-methylfumaryl-CoA hydratase
VVADEVLLFRFFALTYNSHRIHYDRRYATRTEGYPDLVVHGPLTAILLADLVRRNDLRPVVAFRFSSRAPLYVGETIHLRADDDGEQITASANRPEGTVSMAAEMEAGVSDTIAFVETHIHFWERPHPTSAGIEWNRVRPIRCSAT